MSDRPTLTFTVAWHALCSDNRKYIGKAFALSPEYRQAKATLRDAAWSAAMRANWRRVEGPVLLVVAVREPDRRPRDLNWQKNLCDAITASEAVWWDDSQVRQAFWYFVGVDKARPGADITVVALPPGGESDAESDTVVGRHMDNAAGQRGR